jgi:N6-adenosine-specific RNA methylase IME4
MSTDACRVLVADPPWPIRDRLPHGGADRHYKLMSMDDIFRFPLPPLADSAYLFLWRLSSMQEEALATARAWGFTPKTELVWYKQTRTGLPWFGMGYHLRASHETCLVATRGRPKPQIRNVRSVIVAPAGRHSEKPDLFYSTVEKFAPGPYDELFARRTRPGWRCVGNEINSEA